LPYKIKGTLDALQCFTILSVSSLSTTDSIAGGGSGGGAAPRPAATWLATFGGAI